MADIVYLTPDNYRNTQPLHNRADTTTRALANKGVNHKSADNVAQ